MEGLGNLQELLAGSVERVPDRPAVGEPGGVRLTYAELNDLSDRMRDHLALSGVQPGDRVAVYLHKSVDAVAVIFGILKRGAVYVPVDATGPQDRCAYIMHDCRVSAVVTEEALVTGLRAELNALGWDPTIYALTPASGPVPLRALLATGGSVPMTETMCSSPGDLAYILYTSGSTGRPKGVMLTHGNARSFVDWCSEVFTPDERDVFSSHAPFHFDLSIFDLYVSLKHGARLVLFGEELGKDPLKTATAIAEEGITVWYSTPSILSLLANYGKLDRGGHEALRLVLFAGEVFPIPQFNALAAHWPHPRYVNLYGPTETNVCTWHEVPSVPTDERAKPFPIGQVCPPNRCRVVDPANRDVEPGDEGELVVSGPNVMVGYWNLPEQNESAFLLGADGTRWYRTGDLVVEQEAGVFIYRGRRDRMVKRRGYRVELGEIEAALSQHADILEVAVIAVEDHERQLRIRAYVSSHEGLRLSVIALKTFCADRLPRYMIPDTFHVIGALPRTSTDKIAYQQLLADARADMASAAGT